MDMSFSSEGGVERARKRRRSNNENTVKNGEKEINIQVVVRCRYFIFYLIYFTFLIKSFSNKINQIETVLNVKSLRTRQSLLKPLRAKFT
jgi:hypothetical protein